MAVYHRSKPIVRELAFLFLINFGGRDRPFVVEAADRKHACETMLEHLESVDPGVWAIDKRHLLIWGRGRGEQAIHRPFSEIPSLS